MQNNHQVGILSIGTAVPAHEAKQADVVAWMTQAYAGQPVFGRWLRALFANSGVETRYSCIEDYMQPPQTARFSPGQPLQTMPTTADRMAIYQRESVPLGVAAATRALTVLAETTGQSLADATASITHLVAVTCTGFFAPGIDLAIARQLGLPLTIGRTIIGFMGCSAAFNGLRTAHQIVRGQPEARVLVVCVELCSLHIQPNADREHLIAASLFADGASAAVVGVPQIHQDNFFLLDNFHTEVKPDTTDEMVWQIGNHGFTLRLSPQIPKHLAQVAPGALRSLFAEEAVDFWAIHPGGPAILDRMVEVFGLDPAQIAASRTVLRRYGNLSSATILFVLDELRRTLAETNRQGKTQSGVAMAFGPGLVIEMVRLTYLPPQTTQHPTSVAARNGNLLEPA